MLPRLGESSAAKSNLWDWQCGSSARTYGPRRQRPCFPASLAGIEGILLRADTVRIVRSVGITQLVRRRQDRFDRDVVCAVNGARYADVALFFTT